MEIPTAAGKDWKKCNTEAVGDDRNQQNDTEYD